MENVLNKKVEFKGRIPVIIISVAALLCSGFGYIIQLMLPVFNAVIFNYHFNFSNLLSMIITLICFLLIVVAGFILTLYAVALFKKFKPRFFIATIFGSIAVSMLVQLFSKIVNSVFSYAGILIWLLLFLCIVAFLSATIVALIKKENKYISIVALLIGAVYRLLAILVYIIDFLNYFNPGYFEFFGHAGIISTVGYYVSGLTIIIGACLLYIALATFVLTFKGGVLKLSPETEGMTTEQILNLLQEKLDNGEITEEDYEEQREFIIGKL